MKKLFGSILVFALCGLAVVRAYSAQDINVTGEWEFQVETANGSGTPSFTFKQEGEKLTGTYKGRFGEVPLTGTVKGNAINFSFKVADFDATFNYVGTVESKDSMKGKVEVGDLGSGTWTAKRKS
ncbi:MAG TPA: hypothetical protein VEF04_04330 [Blastocatellia bacterium]|nr:hypothetical protein [Blastocatellia bacterium]